jgi:hypothetical protein
MFIATSRLEGGLKYHISMMTRETLEDDWGAPVDLGSPVNVSGVMNFTPAVSADGLTLVLCSDRSGGSGLTDIYMTTRATKDSPWAVPVNLGPLINSSNYEVGLCLSTDTLELYFGSMRSGGSGNMDLWVTRRATAESAWDPPVNLGPMVNSPYEDYMPSLSPDGLCLMFCSARPGGYGSRDIWITTRASKNDPWRTPVNLGPSLNTPAQDWPGCFAPDGSTFYFATDRAGGYGKSDLYQVSVKPVVDFNGDGVVDIADVGIMLEHWLTDYPLCDIGPMPWGDGIVDVQDLIVLAEHLFEDYRSTVVERRISASSDDAEEALNPGYTNWNYSSDLEIVDDIDNGGRQLIGLTFRDIYIAPGELISNAYIEFVCDETKNGTDAAYFLIWGHLTPNSEGFIAPYVISNRPKTEAKVPWEPDPWNAVGQKIQTVNIASIIQELIDQQGWAAGNAVEIIIGADPARPSFTGVRVAESYDGPPSDAPLLHIEIAVP